MQWIDRKNGYPKLKTEIIGNYAKISVTLEISKNHSLGFGATNDMNMKDAILYVLNNFKSLEKELEDELKECRKKLQ